MVDVLVVGIIAFLSAFVPGVLFSLALLRKTKLSLFEILVIGFIFGLIAAPTLTWLESYLANYIPEFDYSLSLFAANVVVLSIAGLILCWQQGVFKSGLLKELKELHINWVWAVLLLLMLITFATRMLSIGIAPKFFEFDPYFDMLDTQALLTYGYQPLYTNSAWPVTNGSLMRIQPIIPYLEAYWYDLANVFGANSTIFDTTLMSQVGSFYPPITAALLVFVIFVLLYYEYDGRIGLIGAALTATMPILFTTFIAGEQLLEPWGIMTLFFFFAAYMLAVKDMKNKRFAILAGIAFASTFLGAHYYTVDAGVLTLYILIQGAINFIRGESNKEFYKMNIIVLAIIAVFLVLYEPYSSALSSAIPKVLGIPLTIGGPVAALIAVMVLDYTPKIMHKGQMLLKSNTFKTRTVWLATFIIIVLLILFLTPLGKPIEDYIQLSKHFTTPSTPLFMTVQEYIPTGALYDFGSAGFGLVGASIADIPITVWLISAIAIFFIFLNIALKNSKTGVLYLAIAVPLMYAGFSEVKYLPHFGAAYIMFFGIVIGELINIAHRNFSLSAKNVHETPQQEVKEPSFPTIVFALFVGLFFISPIFAIIYLIWLASTNKLTSKSVHLWLMVMLFIIIEASSLVINHSFILGEISSIINAARSAFIASGSAGQSACNTIASQGGSIGYDLYCNVVPEYWLMAMSWLKNNVGPHAPRVLSWWDYGDWINWFGNSFAVLRGDNAAASEDYAVAATFVLGPKNGYTPQVLANLMNTNQTGYVLFDQDLVQKWQALDFLACVHINATSRAYAISQGQSQSTPSSYVLGTSPCELSHDPQFVLLPYITNATSSLSFYCTISNNTVQYLRGYLVTGQSLSNGTVCINPQPDVKGVLNVYSSNGTKLNAVVQASFSSGLVRLSGLPFVELLMIYTPDAPNGTITNAPSSFYNSNFYKGFFLGNLAGFTEVYPEHNVTGINMVNFTAPVRIFRLDNFTGSLPKILQKPPYVYNNYTMPA